MAGVAMVVAVAIALVISGFPCFSQQLGPHGLIIAAKLPLKGEEVEAEHIKGGHAGGDEASHPEHGE